MQKTRKIAVGIGLGVIAGGVASKFVRRPKPQATEEKPEIRLGEKSNLLSGTVLSYSCEDKFCILEVQPRDGETVMVKVKDSSELGAPINGRLCVVHLSDDSASDNRTVIADEVIVLPTA